MIRRRGGREPRPALALVLALALGACTARGAEAPGPSGVPSPSAVELAPGALARAACSLPHRYLLRIWRGTFPGRSGQILLVPREPNFLGTNFPHSGPWDYLQDVPLFWYGPGIVPARGSVDRPASIADIAPTQAKLLGFDLPPVDGRALPEIPAPSTPPRLIVTLVWDAGGMSVLDAFPEDWPELRALIPKGVWYTHAEVGSSPSITPATHATIGTGLYPMHTGQTDAEFFVGDEIVRAGALGPQLLLRPTLGDLYDRAMGNRPLVGDLASVTWHLNMMSHGAGWGGGDRDIAVLRVPSEADNEGAEGTIWNLQGKNRPFFRFPAYVNDLPPLSAYLDAVDRADGALDGRWRDNSIQQYEGGWATPARIPYQERMVEEVITREGFGADDVPDLLFINFKAIDHVSHIWSVNSPEMRDTLRWQDAALGDFVRFLDRVVGRGNYVLVLTADHGAQFDPKVSGAFQVTPRELQADLEAAFPSTTDRPVFAAVRTSQIYLDEDAMRASGYTVGEIARWLLAYTQGQGAAEGGAPLPERERNEPFFSAVIPTDMLARLPCLPEARR